MYTCVLRNISHKTTAGLDARNNRVKNNLPPNRDSYEHSEITVGKLLKRRIQSRWVFFYIIIFRGVVLCNIFNNDPTKKDPPRLDASGRDVSSSIMEHKKHPGQLDASRRDLSDGSLGSFVTISVCW